MGVTRSHLRTALATREIAASADACAVLEALRGAPYPWLLDSARCDGRLGRYSFAGSDPYLVLRVRGRRSALDCRRGVRPDLPEGRSVVEGDPFELVRGLLPRLAPSAGPELPFVGGAVGYLGYELAATLERLAFRNADPLELPDAVLLFVDRLVALDVARGRARALALGFGADEAEARSRAAEAARELAERVGSQLRAAPRRAAPLAAHAAREPVAPVPVRSAWDERAYVHAVARVKERIAAGDLYQACLTHQLEAPAPGDPWALYRRLRRVSPAPFAAYLELPEVAVLSSSPERFLRLAPDGAVESRPIKGTRPRGKTPEDDAALRRELAHSPKDRAENVMIVDLVRNDLGRVCETGSVHVPELARIETYATVFQLVSTVRGRLRPGCDVVDLLHAAFPPGSMTGAPKIAAMRLLEQLETRRRGIYSGAIGYLDARGGADLSVVIRTLLVRDGRALLDVGGGIVADSDGLAEWQEAMDKALAPRTALAF